VVVRVPGGDLRQPPDPAVPGSQVRGAQARDQPADRLPAATQVRSRLGPGHYGGILGVTGVQRVHDLAVHLDRLTGDELADPTRQVLVRVRDVIYHHRHRPGVIVQRRRAPFFLAAAGYEADQPVPGRIDIGGAAGRVPRVLRHDSYPTNRCTPPAEPEPSIWEEP
jgi:hypothetical protein